MSPLFKRNDRTTIAELEEYYANQKKRRTGTAWFMAFLSLLITVVVIVLLFLGGRWIYQTVTDDGLENTGDSSAVEEEDIDLPTFDSDQAVTEGSNDTETNGRSEGTVSEEAASTDTPNTDRLAANNNSSSVASDNDTNNIPETGAGETVLIVLAAVTVLGYVFSLLGRFARNN